MSIIIIKKVQIKSKFIPKIIIKKQTIIIKKQYAYKYYYYNINCLNISTYTIYIYQKEYILYNYNLVGFNSGGQYSCICNS